MRLLVAVHAAPTTSHYRMGFPVTHEVHSTEAPAETLGGGHAALWSYGRHDSW